MDLEGEAVSVRPPSQMEVPEPRNHDASATLRGRRVHLRPVVPADYPALYRMATAPETIVRWRHRGVTPNPDTFGEALWQGVLSQFVIVRPSRSEPIGLIVAYNANLRHQTVAMALLVAPEYEKQGWIMDSTALFLVYLFETWPFRKVYYEMIEFNYARISSGAGRHFHIEGCLRDHEYHDSKYWHHYILAAYRDEYLEFVKAYYSRIVER
jgi:RimJ/RimL family protein N-acetyltransferase